MNKNTFKPLPPFKGWVLQNFPFIEEDFDAITNYQLYCKIVEYISKISASQNEVVNNMNTLNSSFTELTVYINNYFENLDIQTEVDSKLDEMAESGQLTDIIAQYLQLAGILAYNTVDDLANAENLNNGSFTKTYGKETYNDGYGAFYKVRELLNTDIIDGDNIVALVNYPDLIAEKIIDKVIENVGNLEDLETTNKDNLVSAINEVNSNSNDNVTNIGNLEDLETTNKDNLVSAINEVNSNSNDNVTNIGNLEDLETTNKNNLVSAINEVNSKKDVYSTNEVKTNKVWIDNRPIYRKVIQFTTDSVSGSFHTVSTGITGNIKITSIDGIVERSNFDNSVPYEESSTGYFYLSYVRGTHNISYKTGSDLVELPVHVIIEYVKLD